MTNRQLVVLSEHLETRDFVDIDVFTDVSRDGDTYTSYRITRFTHAILNNPDGWNFVADVVALHTGKIGICTLIVEDRVIIDSKVTDNETPIT